MHCLHAKGVLFKPFRLDQLIDVVKTILDFNEEVKTSGIVPPKPIDLDESEQSSGGNPASDPS